MKTIGKVFLALVFAGILFAMINMFRAEPEDGPVCLPLNIFCTNVQP